MQASSGSTLSHLPHSDVSIRHAALQASEESVLLGLCSHSGSALCFD